MLLETVKANWSEVKSEVKCKSISNINCCICRVKQGSRLWIVYADKKRWWNALNCNHVGFQLSWCWKQWKLWSSKKQTDKQQQQKTQTKKPLQTIRKNNQKNHNPPKHSLSLNHKIWIPKHASFGCWLFSRQALARILKNWTKINEVKWFSFYTTPVGIHPWGEADSGFVRTLSSHL